MEKQSRFFKRKGAVILLVLASMLFVGIVATHIYMKQKYNPDVVISEFKEAIRNEDYESLAQIMNEGQNKLRVSKEEAKKYAVYLQQIYASEELEELINRLINEGNVITDGNGNKLFSLVEEKKKWFFYPEYEIQFYPIELLVSSYYPGTDIFVDKEKMLTLVDTHKMNRVAYLFPGEHRLKATYKNEYTKLLFEEEIDFSNANQNRLKVTPKLEGKEVKIYSNDVDAILYVNGKNTGKKISEVKEFGPVPMDGSVTIQAERTIGNLIEKTDAVTVVEPEVNLMFEIDYMKSITADQQEFSKEDIKQFMESFFESATIAINKKDASILLPYIDAEDKIHIEANQYFERIENTDVTRKLLNTEVINITPLDEGYSVVSNQVYQLIYADQKETQKTYQTQHYIIRDGNELKVHTMIDRFEI
ncbi:TcaA 3rd/4th domain-containing protein [Bacillus massilioanorexius]|nr:hypothetical protein [Bacillus massilioanorexius]